MRIARTLFAQKTVSLVSYPVNLGQPLLGPDVAPSLLFKAGLVPMLERLGWAVKSLPEVNCAFPNPHDEHDSLNAKNCRQVGLVCQEIERQLAPEAATDNFLLILGGDHCIPIGTIPAIKKHRPGTGVVWVDAHADLNTPASSSSGNMHGMPLGFLLNLLEERALRALPNLDWFTPPYLNPQDLVYIGLRDLDVEEKKAIKRLGIRAYTMYDIDRLGIGRVMEECSAHLRHCENLHLSYDIDAIDPFFAPHTGTTVRGGLTFREGNYICEALFATGKLQSMELVELNPSLELAVDNKLTMDMAMTIIGSTMGQTIL